MVRQPTGGSTGHTVVAWRWPIAACRRLPDGRAVDPPYRERRRGPGSCVTPARMRCYRKPRQRGDDRQNHGRLPECASEPGTSDPVSVCPS